MNLKKTKIWLDEQWLPGVLSKRQMKKFVKAGYIDGIESDKEEIYDYSSLDLHLSDKGYRMLKGAVKPCGDLYMPILNDHSLAEELRADSNGCFTLKSHSCYVFRLKEKLIPSYYDECFYGQATAKSSIGRLDVIARLIVEGMYSYEQMYPFKENFSGNMFLEVIPISFDICVKEGTSLSQLRLFYGSEKEAIIDNESLIRQILHGSDDGKGFLSVEVKDKVIGGIKVAAFRAKKDIPEYIDLSEKEATDPCKYFCFESVGSEGRLAIKNGEFYILRSKERIALPSGVAVYCRPMDETLGEMRIHYAGFAHPFFGMERKDKQIGTPLIFEVRGHNVDVNLADNEKLARLTFYRMSEEAEKEKKAEKESDNSSGPYDNQDLTLSNLFKKWPDKLKLGEDGAVEPDE